MSARRAPRIGPLPLALALLSAGVGGCTDPPTPERAPDRFFPEQPPPPPPPKIKFDVGAIPEPAADPQMVAALQGRLAEGDFGKVGLRSADAVRQFYAQRGHAPAWIYQGQPTGGAAETLQVLGRLGDHGLDPADYDIEALTAEAAELTEPELFELRLTDTWLTVGAHLLRGRIDPVKVHPAWSVSSRSADLVSALQAGLDEGSPGAALEGLAPRYPEYAALQQALRALRVDEEVGPWPTVSGPLPLATGSSGPAVAALRARLARTDGLADGTTDTFDAAVAEAVRRFQRRHGLDDTGQVDARTAKALAVPIGDRIAQVEANLERWRWLPEDLGPRHVRVNIAAFDVVLVDGTERSLAMKAVVGKRYRTTPVFSTTIEQVTVNPRWMVPPKLAVQDLLPEIKKDPSTIEKKRLRVLDAKTTEPVDPSTIDWSRLSARRFPYLLRQEPGPDNALGRFKFVMPNDYDVYLHDTPKRHLFGEEQRARSSGCVRLEKPRDLAVALLKGHPKWTPTKLDAVVADGRELTIRLPTPVPVHLQYWTAFVDEAGVLQLRADLYGRDAALRAALARDAEGRRH